MGQTDRDLPRSSGIFHFDLVDVPRNHSENQLVPLVFTKDAHIGSSVCRNIANNIKLDF